MAVSAAVPAELMFMVPPFMTVPDAVPPLEIFISPPLPSRVSYTVPPLETCMELLPALPISMPLRTDPPEVMVPELYILTGYSGS